ncbi:MAG: hypothetical protein KDB86_05400 [Actinobacteria bacterium]|nr:hypothetical protein [Actinomycetota bacterium]MCB9390079.1 hypothetical protein [Acidimicrobiia bacterium]
MRRFVALCAVVAVFVVGCGSDDDDDGSTADNSSDTTTVSVIDSDSTIANDPAVADVNVAAADFGSAQNCDQLAVEVVHAIDGLVTRFDTMTFEEAQNLTPESQQALTDSIMDQDALDAAQERLSCDDVELATKVCDAGLGDIKATGMLGDTILTSYTAACVGA